MVKHHLQECVGSAYAHWNYNIALHVADSLLRLYPDVDLIAAHNDDMAQAAREACVRLGIDPIPQIVGVDALPGPDQGIDNVARGKQTATCLNPSGATEAFALALDILMRHPFPRHTRLSTFLIDEHNVSFINMQRQIYVAYNKKIEDINGELGDYWRRNRLLNVLLIASVLIIALIVVLVLVFGRMRRTQMRLRETVDQADKNKLSFFTNVSHSFRTPLTLITAPLEVLRQRLTANASLSAASTGSATEAAAAPVQEDRELQTISRNVDRLMTLATQLLDFQRLAGQEMSLTMEEVNVSALVRETVVRFEDAFRYRGKRMELVESDEDIVTVVDREAITKILSNLFNNALKYCDQATVVELTHDSHEFKLRVTSDGKRIPNERNEEIFRPFVQLETPERISGGIGIGLGMARSLALLHHGTLALDLHHEQNSFVLAIPLAARQPQEARAEAASESRTEDAEADAARTESAAIRYTLLVVEDDEEILMLLNDQLKEQYHVLTAHNGAEALDVLGKHDVDLVITDLMMPVMDGYSLCEHIKSDAEHNQTPVVVLTALGDIDNKLKSLQCGAEAFIEKPFSVSYLLSQVATILDNRYRERVAFSKRPYIPENSCRTDREDKELVDRIIAITEQNLRDGDFNVGNLASELCMSRSSLLRRIRTLFNVSPVELIRLIRLKHAAELIQDGRYRLGEISTMVGFNSPSYFSKLFARQFGMTPKEFEKQVEQKRTKVGAESHLDITEMIRNMSREEEIAHE